MIMRRSFLGGLAAAFTACRAGRADGISGAGGSSGAGGAGGAGGTSGIPALGSHGDGCDPVEPILVWEEYIYGIGNFTLWEYNKIGHPFMLKEPPRIKYFHLVERIFAPADQSLMSDGFTPRFRRLCVTWERGEHDDPNITEIIRDNPVYISIRYENKVARTIEMVPDSLIVDYDEVGDVTGVELFGPVKVRDFMRALTLPMGCTIADLAKFSMGC